MTIPFAYPSAALQFLTSFSQVVVAGAVGTFYWCRADSSSEEMKRPISSARPGSRPVPSGAPGAHIRPRWIGVPCRGAD